jgi:hypothetical protein
MVNKFVGQKNFDTVEKVEVSLNSDNNGYFTWRTMYIYDISLNSTKSEKCLRQKL